MVVAGTPTNVVDRSRFPQAWARRNSTRTSGWVVTVRAMVVTTHDDVRIRLLGPVELAVPHDDLGGPKQRLLLGALGLRAGSVVPSEDLVEVLWPDRLPEDPQRSLQVHVSKLRRVLSAAGIESSIEHRGRGYVLVIEPSAVDAICFERLVEEGVALAEDAEQAREVLRRALALWRGRPLGGVAGQDALRGEIARLDSLHLQALEARIGADLATGRHGEVISELRRLTDAYPMQEQLWGHLLLALYRSGRQGEALEAYERARDVLANELGTDPSRALQDLHRRILQQDPALDATSRTPSPAAAEKAGDPRSIAVLPFDVLGGSEEAGLLASGLHNDLLTELSKNAQLTVISRTSVLGFRGTDKPAPVIARELAVGTIVQGAVQSAGSRVRLTIQLVDGSRDAHRWAQSYDDELTTDNLFAIQTDLARDIAASLSAELLPPATAVDGPDTVSLDAYRLVAAGRQQFDLKTGDGFAQAIECYEEAIRLDADYANAWAGLADALVSMDAYGHGPRHELLPRAEKAVHRALSLNPDSAEARTSLGVLHVGHQEGPAALTEFRRAMQTRPNYADAHNWNSWVSLLTGDARAGLDSARRATELDPRSAEGHAHVALGLAATGDPGGALDAARTAQRLSPYTTAELYEGLCLYELGHHDEARDVLRPLVLTSDEMRVPWAACGPHALLVLTLVALGDHDAAREVADRVDPVAFPFATGVMRLGLGDEDGAAQVIDRIDRLTAWPCLVVHHYHRDFWTQNEHVAALHRRLRDTAVRSWHMPVPTLGKQTESDS